MSTPENVEEALGLILDAVANDAAVKAIVGDPARVYLHVPEKPTNPLIVGRITSVVDASTKDADSQNGTLAFTYWSSQRGDAELYAIWKAVYSVVQRLKLPLTSARLVKTWHASTSFQIHQDGLSYFAVDSYNFIIS